MADAQLASARVRALGAGDDPELQVKELRVRVLYTFPSEEGQASSLNVRNMWAGSGGVYAQLNHSRVRVLIKGRRENRVVRAWGFSQDGHDFYVLRLGETMTLVYDVTTEQWSRWATADLDVLRAHLGLNWTGQGKTTLDSGYSWNVVGGDDTTGDVWIFDPNVSVDSTVADDTNEFERQVIGQFPVRLRDSAQCGAVYLLANLAFPVLTAPTVKLETSDDLGYNWVDHGSVTVSNADTNQEIGWIGLGIMTAPGRLFRITDSGAFARISSLDIRP